MSKPIPNDFNNLGPSSTTPVARPLRPGWLERHQRYCARAARGEVDLVFLGDSLTQRWEGAPVVWEQHFGRRRAVQMGIDNDGTQQVLWRIDHGTLDGIHPRLIVLLIGINNIGNDAASPQEVCDGVAAILGRLRHKTRQSRVLLLGLLPYGYPGTDIGNTIADTNRLLAQLADGRAVQYLDIGPRLLVDGRISPEIQPDGAHLSERGYAIYAEAIEPVVSQVFDPRAAEKPGLA